jgi:O-antigen/teichoic acid export membrane protein
VNQYKRLAGHTIIYGLGTIVPRLLNYVILTPFYTNLFSKQEFGVVTELYAYVVFLMVVLTYGLETGYFRFAKTEKDPKQVFSTIIASLVTTTLLFLLLVSIFLPDISELLKYENKPYLILLFSAVVALDAFSAVPFAKIRYHGKPKRFGYLKIFNVLANLFFVFLFYLIFPYIHKNFPESPILLLYNPDLFVAYVFIANLLASLLTLLLLLPDININFRLFDARLLKRILKYSLPLLIVGFAGSINEVADKMFLKQLIPDPDNALEQIGVYGANYKIGMMMTIFIQMFRYAAEPFYFSKMRDSDAKVTYAKVMRYFLIFCFFIFLFIILYLDIIKYFIDEKFHEGLHIVPIILLANLFLGIVINLSIWYKLSNRTHYGAVISLLGAGITITGNILLIPKLGYVGSAWTTLACYSVMMIISFFFGRKFYPVPYPLKSVFYYAALAAVIYVLQDLVNDFDLFIKLLINSLFLFIFVIFVILHEKITITDIRNIFNQQKTNEN